MPLILNNKLKAIFFEYLFPNAISDNQLYGHLSPKWWGEELKVLASLVQKEHAEVALLGLEYMLLI